MENMILKSAIVMHPICMPSLLLPRHQASAIAPVAVVASSSSSSSSRPSVAAVAPPPSDYDHIAETRHETLRIVSNDYPQLLDLAQDGTLVAVGRRRDYTEWRRDGFVEPCIVFLVGTSHMSNVSALHVQRIVEAVRPDNVVVELCRSRVGIMYNTSMALSKEDLVKSQPNIMSMTGENFGAAVGRSLQLGGQPALALRLLLAFVSQKLSSVAGVPSGEEFRAARRISEEVGAQLVLGDRPIEITLQRAWDALSWMEKLKLIFILLRGINTQDLDVSESALQTLRTDSGLSTMFTYLGDEFPSLLQPLVHERDRYLAWSMKRSKAVNGCSRVVGVMGMGHMRGVVYALKHDQEGLRFRDLAGSKRSSNKQGGILGQFLKRLAMDTLLGIILWIVYEYLHKELNIFAFFGEAFSDHHSFFKGWID